ATAIAVRIAPSAMSHGGGAYIRSPPRVVGLRWYKLRESVSLPPDRRPSLRELAAYFLRLGAIGFGGPAALVGYMRKDLVEERKVVTEQTYNLALALAQIMPGPLAAQTAIAIGYFEHGVAGATLVGLAFILPSFALVIAISWLYVAYGGLPAMQALFSASDPCLHDGVVKDFGWLTEGQFLDAVAVALITPGPVVITVAFIGYLVAGFAGATVASIGIFLPVYFFTIVPAPWFRRHRDNAQLRAFVSGATAAASGAIAGAVVVLAQRAIVDVPTAAIALTGLVLLARLRLPEPLLVMAAGVVGLLLSR